MKRKPRLVLDTNVVVSALFWDGKPLELMALAVGGEVRLYASPALLAELRVTLAKPKLVKALEASGRSVVDHLDAYRRLVTLTHRAPAEGAWSRDPDDDRVVACALAVRADFVVTGDEDLLTLAQVEDVAIRTVAELLTELTSALL
jgi:putative PIN family toxin of toxin-antitoxin system